MVSIYDNDFQGRRPQSSNGFIPGYEKNRPRKLSPRQCDEIHQRLQDGEDPKDLALEYHVTASYIRTFK